MNPIKWIVIASLTCLAACQLGPADKDQGTVYLVRHAEKTTVNPDPGLTLDGQTRAEQLADRLEDAGITAIWTTDYARTRATAAPLAARLGLDVRLYNPGDLPGFASYLKTHPQDIALVVGHSNTTPQLVELLGGDPVSPINEDGEYDRLYTVSTTRGTSQLQRFGVAYLELGSDE